MALISCPDCKKEISDKAPTCPGCGAPIAKDQESVGSGVTHLVTTQETSKTLKLQSLLSGIVLGLGFIWLMLIPEGAEGGTVIVPTILVSLALFWYIATRVRIWWHHK